MSVGLYLKISVCTPRFKGAGEGKFLRSDMNGDTREYGADMCHEPSAAWPGKLSSVYGDIAWAKRHDAACYGNMSCGERRASDQHAIPNVGLGSSIPTLPRRNVKAVSQTWSIYMCALVQYEITGIPR